MGRVQGLEGQESQLMGRVQDEEGQESQLTGRVQSQEGQESRLMGRVQSQEGQESEQMERVQSLEGRSCLQGCLEKERKEKITPFGVNFEKPRSIYRAAQGKGVYLKCRHGHGLL